VIVCLAANPSIDKLFEVEEVTPGQIHRPGGFVQVAGGKGLNVARAVASLGADVVAVALLRGHAGKWIEEALAAEGVRSRIVWTHGENRSALSVADRETGGLTEFYENGSDVPSSAWPELAHAAEDEVRAAGAGSWFTISGSVPKGIPLYAYRELIPPAHEAGARVAIDAHGEPLGSALTAGPDLVKVNAFEASTALGSKIDSALQAADAATEFRRTVGGDDHGAVVTKGGAGALMAAPDGTRWQGGVDAIGDYPVGSGDSFLAGFVVALDRGSDWKDAFRLALGAAAANALMPGAGRFERSQAESFAAEARLDEVPAE
jgi:1-phosphofructokinase family hexose kinase